MQTDQKVFFDWYLPIASLKGVGDKFAEKLAKMNITQVGDLLLHCPYRYENRTQLTPIRHAKTDQYVLIQGIVQDLEEIKRGKKRCTVTLSDKSASIQLIFFNYYASQLKLWQPGTLLRCYGQVKHNLLQIQMIHPEFELVQENTPLTTVLTPIYPTVAGVAQGQLRKLIAHVLEDYTNCFKDEPDGLIDYLKIPISCVKALNCIHSPQPQEDIDALLSRTHLAYERLIAEEFMVHRLSLQNTRLQYKHQKAPVLGVDEPVLKQFLSALAFQLTDAQVRVWQEIRLDLARSVPMLRLVQGDVGCGKTVIAALGALCAVGQRKQVAIMAPTEILAEQHAAQFEAWFAGIARVTLLNGKMKAKEKRGALENIQLGLVDIVIGTHALFQESVVFNDLGLAIIDEQHRFGVHQRLSLQQKGVKDRRTIPHQLIMTATPIPRTLAMSHYAHLDISIIDSLPPGRKAVKTLAFSNSKRDEIIDRIKSVCQNGQQVYWVCTLIEDSEVLSCQAAQASFEYLQKAIPYSCGLAHGRLTHDEKQAVMQAFYRNEISVLVATTVIEVGVNVPNATLMIIENPERLGLAQLHQLRGRVGRGGDESYCVLLYQSPLSPMAKARIQIMRETNDGFKIAEADLALRGPGEFLGAKQTGTVQFRVADLNRDQHLMNNICSRVENLNLPEAMLRSLCKRWGLEVLLRQA